MNLTKWNDYKLPILEARKGKPDPVIDEAFNQISAIFQEIRDWAKTQTHAAPTMSPIDQRRAEIAAQQQAMQASVANISSLQGIDKQIAAQKVGIPRIMQLGLTRDEKEAKDMWFDIKNQRTNRISKTDATFRDPGVDKLPNAFLGLENVQEIDFLADKEAEVRKIINEVHKNAQSAAHSSIHNTVAQAMLASQNALSPDEEENAVYNLKLLADFMRHRKEELQLYFVPVGGRRAKVHIGRPEPGRIVLRPDGANAEEVLAKIRANKMLEIHGPLLAAKGKKTETVNIGKEGSVANFLTKYQ